MVHSCPLCVVRMTILRSRVLGLPAVRGLKLKIKVKDEASIMLGVPIGQGVGLYGNFNANFNARVRAGILL